MNIADTGPIYLSINFPISVQLLIISCHHNNRSQDKQQVALTVTVYNLMPIFDNSKEAQVKACAFLI